MTLRSRAAPAVLAAIAALAVGFRLRAALTTPFWFDEAFSWRVSQAPLGELVRRVGLDNHSPLYFALLRLWTAAFGTSVLALRALSIGLAAASILALVALCVAALGEPRGRAAGLIAGTLAACAPLLVDVGAQARMYPLALLACTLSSLALLRASRRETDALAWAAYGAAAAVSVYAHYFSIFVVLAHVLYCVALAISRKRLPAAALAAPLVFAALFAPWLPTFLAQRQHTAAQWWAPPVTVEWVARLLPLALVDLRAQPALWLVLGADAVALALVAWLALRGAAGERFLALLASVPLAGSVLASIGGANLVLVQSLTFTVWFVCAAAGALIAGSRLRVPITLALAAGLGFQAAREERSVDYREVVAWLAREQRGAPVVIDSFDYFAMRYYAPDSPAWLVFGEGAKVAFFNGAALVSEREQVIGGDDLARLRGRFLIVENAGGFDTRHVPAPAAARAVARHAFAAGAVIATVYDR